MKWFSRNAAYVAAVSLFLGAALAVPASAQQAQDIVPLPAPVPVTQPVEPTSTPAAEPAGPRVRPEFRRAEPAALNRADAAVATRKDSMHTITISTIALVLLVVILVLLIS